MLSPLASVVLPSGVEPSPAEAPSGSGVRGSNSSVRESQTREAFAAQLSSSVTRVDAHRTPISASVARDAIARAYFEATGERLSDAGQSILTAQWAHETAHGASMFNFNFGGIKGVGPSGLTVAQRTKEGYGQSERRITDQFRAYGTIDEGARDYVRLLRGRYAEAVSAAQNGDASGFVRVLKQRGYFTGDPAAYERNIVSLAKGFGATELELTSNGNSFGGSNSSVGGLARASTRSGSATQSTSGITGSRTVPSLDPMDTYRTRALNWEMGPMGALLASPTPSALLDATDSAASSTNDGRLDVSFVQAISMADEVARAALQIAREDEERRRDDGLGTATQG
ncbi:MAG: hypothetical protein QM784_06545 [Polyangiaceae bacterium]